jgi:hypothetical protein
VRAVCDEASDGGGWPGQSPLVPRSSALRALRHPFSAFLTVLDSAGYLAPDATSTRRAPAGVRFLHRLAFIQVKEITGP